MVRRKNRPVFEPILPGYRDAEEIGGGAFATVYRAIEVDTGRPVALKILKVDTVHPHLMESFAQEIQALAKVSDHPNIVTLYRPLATPDGRPVLVLELCRESLAHQVRRGGLLDAQQVARIAVKIAGALETAHRHGFLHRDMKPQNILLTQFGEPALGDFGVAALQASAQATAGVFGFTTLHAAPEILEGHHLSPATDVYGLASTMYQLLSGSAPFATFDNEAPASVILRIIRDPVRPLRAADIPIALSDLLERSLAKDPEGRPRTALEFADALAAVEAQSGWTPTAYVVWGQEGPAEDSGAPPAPAGPAPAEPAREERPAAQGSPLSARAPSVTVPDAVLARPTLAATGPAVSQPPAAVRDLIAPDQVGRGHDSPRVPSVPSPPLHPLRAPAEGASSPAPRPVFVDPPSPSGSMPSGTMPSAQAGRGESVYEQTIPPPMGPVPTPGRDQAAAAGSRSLTPPPLVIAGMAAAIVVVIAAVLLIVGVL